jgi:transcriptional regulator with XRE-family HTH domain
MKLADMVPGVVLMRAEGRTLQQIADVLHVTRQRVSQIAQAAKKLELYNSGHLYPGAVWSFGRRSYQEICEWLGVPPLKKRPKHRLKCPHCQGFI